MGTDRWIAQLEQIVGPDHLLADERRGRYAIDAQTPAVVACPASVEEAAEVMKVASSAGVSVAPWGGGTTIGLGNVSPRLDLVVALGRLDRIVDHEPGDLTATVEGGVRLAEAQAVLGQNGQFLPLDPPLADRATIGGILAANASGPRRLRYGSARDLLIAIRVVHADGTVTRGGARVVKNVTGYDMNKLYIGSLGTLGLIVEASFKVYPRPAAERTWLASFGTGEAAAAAVAAIMASPVVATSVELVSAPAARSVAARAGLSLQGMPVLLATSVASVPEAVEAQIETVATICERRGADSGLVLEGERHEAFWTAAADFPWAEDADRTLAILKASVLPTKVFETIRLADVTARPLGLESAAIAEAATGTVRFRWTPAGPIPAAPPTAIATAIEVLRGATLSSDGSLVVWQAPPSVKVHLDAWGPVGTAVGVMRELKRRFDPQGILNRGRFVGGI